MKTLNYITAIVLMLFTETVFGQQEFCPGNFFANGDLETGTPTLAHQDINLASGFSAIWIGGGSISLADYYTETTVNTGLGSVPPPSPPTGNYASFWVSNHPFLNNTWREGLFNTFNTPINPNTGNYTFTFDVACLYKDQGVNADVELGVYGIYNPSGTASTNVPTANFTPSNLGFFPGQTVLLGTIPITGDCSNIKQNYSISINTTGLPITQITHIMITHSDTVISYADGGGKRYIAVDNFCLAEKQETKEGDYCCEDEKNSNLVNNGNFEFGNNGFSSNYTQTITTFPGEYDVVTSAAAFGTTVNDHSFCTDSSLYATNDMFMVVNGKTQQSGYNTIWEQNITGLREGKEYKLCANFKDMEQCTFNILPKIKLIAGSDITMEVINTDDTNPCDWQRVELCFTATDSTMNIRIELDESGNGDGNDLAIDDISVQEKLDPNYFITVQHQGNTNEITGSLNTMAIADDILLNDECELENRYYWFVYETLNPTTPLWGSMVPGTFAWSSNTSFSGPGVTGVWGLTTTFPDYVFGSNKFYVIGMYIPSCCESCYTDGWAYQITYNWAGRSMEQNDLDAETKAKIIESFVKKDYSSNTLQPYKEKLSVFPNPAQDKIVINTELNQIESYTITNTMGSILLSEKMKNENFIKEIDINNLKQGVYILTVIENDIKKSTRFIKK